MPGWFSRATLACAGPSLVSPSSHFVSSTNVARAASMIRINAFSYPKYGLIETQLPTYYGIRNIVIAQ